MSIRTRIEDALERIGTAREGAGRTDPVELELAVKTRTPEECREAAQALADLGRPILLGHNRVQEARDTAPAIREVPGAQIRLIGPLQSNKINQALACVDAIESVDSPALVAKIDARAERRIPVLAEVNVSGEGTKHGCHPEEVGALVEALLAAEHLSLAGFMTVGLNSPVEKDVRAAYALLRDIRDRTEDATGLHGLELSMSMSADLEWAIGEGASIVRVGTAVFGARPAAPTRP